MEQEEQEQNEKFDENMDDFDFGKAMMDFDEIDKE